MKFLDNNDIYFQYTLNKKQTNKDFESFINIFLNKNNFEYKIKHSICKTHLIFKIRNYNEKETFEKYFKTFILTFSISLKEFNNLSNNIIFEIISKYKNKQPCSTFNLLKKKEILHLSCLYECINKHSAEILIELKRESKNISFYIFNGYLFDENYLKDQIFILNRINNPLYISNKKIVQSTEIFSEIISVEYIKLIYILYYKRKELENILNFYKCYLNFDFIPFINKRKKKYFRNNFPEILIQEINLKIFSNSNLNFFQIIYSLNSILNEIVIFNVNLSDNILLPGNLFLFKFKQGNTLIKENNNCLIIGEYGILKYFIDKKITYYHTLTNDDFEFVLGKKNGKINKIMKSCEKTIISLFSSINNLENFGAENLSTIIVITSNIDFIYESLLNEHPESLIFSIPGFFHKRIIGFGGRNIQKIMKKYGVYVKFMTHSESIRFNGNVLIKTPFKNRLNLIKMKDEILKLSNDILSENSIQLINYNLIKSDLNNNNKELIKQNKNFIKEKYWIELFFKKNLLENNEIKDKNILNYISEQDSNIIVSSFGLEHYISEVNGLPSSQNYLLIYKKKTFFIK